MPQPSNHTNLMLALLSIVLFLPVYGEVFLHFGWTTLSIVSTCVVQVAFFWSVALAFRRRRN
jgi:ATP/ADP translocase